MAKEILSPELYQNTLVDFYKQTLGTTGIQTTKPEDEEEKDKREQYVAPTILDDGSEEGDSLFAGIGRDAGTKTKNIENILDFKTNNKTMDNLELKLPSSYSEHLGQNNREDKADLSKFQTSITNQLNKTQTLVNKNLQKNFKVSIDFPDAKQAQRYAGVQIFGTALSANPFVTMGVASAVAGKTEKSIKGGQTFKPSGVPGIIHDVSQSLELESIRNNQEAYRKAQDNYMLGSFSRLSEKEYYNNQDVGFSFNVDGNEMTSIYRTAGSKIYNGAMYNMSQEQARRLEALGKGKNTFNFNPLNPDDSENLISTDREGGYDEKGNFHDARFGVSATGRERNAINAAKTAGISLNQFKSALSRARSGQTTLSNAIKSIKQEPLFSQIQKQTDDEDGEKSKTTPPEVTAIDDFRDFTPPSDFDYDYEGGVAQGAGEGDYDEGTPDPGEGMLTAMGGRIGMKEGGNTTEVVRPAGFIAPDPNATDQQEIADDKPIDAKDGDFIINAPAAEDAGKQDIQRMINTAIRNLQEKGVDVRFGDPKINVEDKVKLLVSRNEVYIPAIIAKEIGYDRLKKINNRGKREVQRRQEESQQEEKPQSRGFISKASGDKITVYRGEPYPEQISEFDKKYMSGRKTTGAWFSSNKSYAKMYGQLQKSLDVTFDEYAKGAKKAEMYRNIASMQSESGKRQLTKDQKAKLFKHVKEIKQMAKQVKDGKVNPKKFVNTLHMALFPEKKEEAIIKKIESYKNNPKLFGKLVVRNLANNIVTKGVPFLSKLSPIGSIMGMITPTKMGDATLNTRGFVDYNPNFPQ
jgi:hypothetical protein